MKNHLIIELGSTGEKILHEVRKQIFEHFDKCSLKELGIEYLYVDAEDNIEELRCKRRDGHIPPLREKSILRITDAHLNVLDNLSAYPGIEHCIAPEECTQIKKTSLLSNPKEEGCRRIGRINFSANLNALHSEGFIYRLSELVESAVCKTANTSITFHICIGLNNVDASAYLIDTIVQIVPSSTPIQQMDLLLLDRTGFYTETDVFNTPIHSTRFLTYGMHRVEYPEKEIRALVTCCFVKQALQQSLLGHRIDGFGFEEYAPDGLGLHYKEEIENKRTREELLLSDDHLTLSRAIIKDAGTAKWKDITSGWEVATQYFADYAQVKSDKAKWFAEFSEMCEFQYHTNYRGEGVKCFYRTECLEKYDYSKHIRRHIENRLYGKESL